MKSFVLIFGIIFCVLNISTEVDGIRCYVCTSDSDGDCKSAKDSHILDCLPIATTCIKQTFSTSTASGISRSCGIGTILANNACIDIELAGAKTNYCECDKDLCNGSGNIFTKSAVFISLTVAVIVAKVSL